MANIACFGTPIYEHLSSVYTPTYSGGDWLAGLPKTNLLDRTSGLVARSTNALITSTTFDEDLLTSRRVGVLGFYNHNCSIDATLRQRLFTALPIFDSLTVGDAAWSATGTPTRSAAAFTCADGMPLDLVGDDDGAATESFFRTVTFTGNGTKAFRFRVAKSSSYATHNVAIYDATAPALRASIVIDFTAATPIVTASVGTVVSSTARGDGSWDVLALTTAGVLAANTNRMTVYPAGGAAGDTAAFYIGDIMSWNAAPDQLAYDSGITPVWPVVYPTGMLAADDPRMATGKYSAEEMIALGAQGWTRAFTPVIARYRRVQIVDTANAAGYVQVARVPTCGAIQFSANFDGGAHSRLASESMRSFAEGGAGIYQAKAIRRGAEFQFSNQTTDEGMLGRDFQRLVGTSEQFVFVQNPDDTYHMPRTAYPAVLRELGALESTFYTYTSTPYSVDEDL